jgi:hypothetical protein
VVWHEVAEIPPPLSSLSLPNAGAGRVANSDTPLPLPLWLEAPQHTESYFVTAIEQIAYLRAQLANDLVNVQALESAREKYAAAAMALLRRALHLSQP